MILDINYTTTNPRKVGQILEDAINSSVSVSGVSPPVMTLPDSSTVQVIKSYTWATLPAPASYIGRAFVSDIGGGTDWQSNGTVWTPVGNVVTLYDMAATNAQTCGTVKVMAQALIPAGLIKNRDKIRITYTYGKSSTVETCSHNIRLGLTGTASDTSIGNTGAPGGTNVAVGNIIEFQRLSATSLLRLGANITAGMPSISTTAIAAAVTVDNMDSSALFLSLTSLSSANAETYTLYDFRVELISRGV